MKEAVIISGGNIDSDFALDFLKKRKHGLRIAADRGMEFCRDCRIIPHHLVGDFDSLSEGVLKEVPKSTVIHRLRPQKDDSDTQSALKLAISLGAERVDILGGTGSRLDHLLANLGLLFYGLSQSVKVCLVDAHNLVSVEEESFTIKKEEQFGRYLSFFALDGPVEGLTLEGFYYPLKEHRLSVTDAGLTVSNEIVAEEARVTFRKGRLLVIQARD